MSVSMTVQFLMLAALSALPGRMAREEHADETTAASRILALERIDSIAGADPCRQAFGRQKIDLDNVRLTVRQLRFYNSEGPEGDLRFSEVVGRSASPNQRLRDLAHGLTADAFVIGYQDGKRYVRTRHIVLSGGYFHQGSPQDGTWRVTTEGEKQALLLHEVLHVALNVDDDDLTRRKLCPLRLLAFCPLAPTGNRESAE